MNDTTPIPLQQDFWNAWNASFREHAVQDVSLRQAEVVVGWLQSLGRRDLHLLEVGCGTGWFCSQLCAFGTVTATDLSNEVLERAGKRTPLVNFVAGDFMQLEFGRERFDVVITLEVLSHVADQQAFVEKLGTHLRPGGRLMMATQNRFVLERFNHVPPPSPGQLRRWVDKRELMSLLAPHFDIEELFTVSPKGNRGLMRIINSYKLNRPLRAFFGNRIDRFKEGLGLGWTLMVLGTKRSHQLKDAERSRQWLTSI